LVYDKGASRSLPGGSKPARQRGKSAQNAKKILNRGNEPKNLLKAKELAFSGAQNEPKFQGQKPQSKLRIRPKNDDLLGIEQNRKLENGNSKIETRKWKLENGAAIFYILLHRMGSGTRSGKTGLPISSFQFPVSSVSQASQVFDHLPPELLYWRKTFVNFESK
jgi:hypothetical protein